MTPTDQLPALLRITDPDFATLEPWTYRGRKWFTDGKVLATIPSADDAPPAAGSRSDRIAASAATMIEFDNPGDWLSWPECPTCDKCHGAGGAPGRCTERNGFGKKECYACGCERSCVKCEGTGKVFVDCDCVDVRLKLGAATVNGWLAWKVSQLGEVRYLLPTDRISPAMFAFANEGRGVLMPIDVAAEAAQ